jgi:chromosome partitioning protein
MTLYEGRTNLAQQVVEDVRRFFPLRFFNTLIPRSVRVSEAPSYGQLLAEYDGQSRAAVAYHLLADEVIQRLG